MQKRDVPSPRHSDPTLNKFAVADDNALVGLQGQVRTSEVFAAVDKDAARLAIPGTCNGNSRTYCILTLETAKKENTSYEKV